MKALPGLRLCSCSPEHRAVGQLPSPRQPLQFSRAGLQVGCTVFKRRHSKDDIIDDREKKYLLQRIEMELVLLDSNLGPLYGQVQACLGTSDDFYFFCSFIDFIFEFKVKTQFKKNHMAKQCKATFFYKLTRGTLISQRIFQSYPLLTNTKPLPFHQ